MASHLAFLPTRHIDTDPYHARSAETLRRAHEDAYHRSSLVEATDVQVRALADYDMVFGLDDGQVA